MGPRPRNLWAVKGVPMGRPIGAARVSKRLALPTDPLPSNFRPTQKDENPRVFDRVVRRLSAPIRQADRPFFWLRLVNWKRAPPGKTPIVKSVNDRDGGVNLEARVASSKPIRGGSLGGADGSSISTSNIAKQRRQVNR